MKKNTQTIDIADWDSFFQSIYTQYYAKLCVFATSIIQNEDEAEEIVQQIIMKLWEQKNTISTIENMNSYLYRSVKNHCLNYIAHQKIKEKYQSEAWFALKAMEINAVDVEEQSKQQEQDEQALKQAIELLPDRCQEVLKMSKFDGLKNKEIAEQLNISVKAVEANITRAFSTLRNILRNKKK